MKTFSSPERLESRIAPALLLTGGQAVAYFDADGDLVTVKTSKGKFQDPTQMGQTMWDFGATTTGIGEQLRQLDLSGLTEFDGANITITAVPYDYDNNTKPDGDGTVDVGYINATGIDLGAVRVRGDLGAIDAGDALSDPALKSLNVLSLGVEGTTTGAPDLMSNLHGPVGSITVSGHVARATIVITGGDQFGTLGSLTVGGALIGGSDQGAGEIFVEGALGKATIGGGLFGGEGQGSGSLQAAKFGSVTIGGSLGGNKGAGSGSVFARDSIGKITIGGSLFGGSGANSAQVGAKMIGSITVGGVIRGGDAVDATLTAAGAGAIVAGNGAFKGAGTIGSVKIGSSLLGGSGENSGIINSAVSIGSVIIGGELSGGDGKFSGSVSTPSLGSIKVTTTIFGGSGEGSGGIFADTSLKSADVGGSLVGHTGTGSGVIRAGGEIGPITIRGGVLGGDGQLSGAVFSQNGGNFSLISIGSRMRGGDGVESGSIFTTGGAKTIFIGASLSGGSANHAGEIAIGKTLGSLTIVDSIIGGDSDGTTIVANTGYVQAQRLGNVSIGGSVVSGRNLNPGGAGGVINSGAVRADFDIGSLKVGGDLNGNSTNPVIISAGGSVNPGATDIAIKSLRVGGVVFDSVILAGYSIDVSNSYLGLAVNADAQIGSIFIGGDFVLSDIIAGLSDGGDGLFGDAQDTKISGAGVRDNPNVTDVRSAIASIVVGGRAYGSSNPASSFTCGIGAEQIGSLKIGGDSVIPLLLGGKNDTFASGNAYALGKTKGGLTDFNFHVYEV